MSEPPPPTRARPLLAGGLAAALLAALVLFPALRGSGSEREFAQAPAGCVERWNGDPAAIALGRHQSGSHHYSEVQVLTLSPDGERGPAPGQPGASCAVVFAASALDPEPAAAAQILRRGAWEGLSRAADPARLAALQAEAQHAYNARLTPEGRIEPLDPTT